MIALQITGLETIQTIELPDPAPLQPTEVLLKIEYVGFCGSDLNTFLGRNGMAKANVIPGHEVSAVVEAVGAEVPSTIQPGMRVTVNPYTNCGHCASCRNGRVNACEHNQTLGVQRDGAMRQFMTLPWQKVIPAPGLLPETIALIEPMSVGFHAVSRAQVTDIDSVMVIGCGMVGLGAIVRAAQRGATVIAADIDDDKLELAQRMGASFTINTRQEDVHQRLQELTAGLGPDVIVEAVGSVPTYQMAVEEVAFTGRIACIGYAKQDATLPTRLFVQKELDIRGSRNATPNDFLAVIRYLQRDTCPTSQLISRIVLPQESQSALQYWSQNPGKVFRMLVKLS